MIPEAILLDKLRSRSGVGLSLSLVSGLMGRITACVCERSSDCRSSDSELAIVWVMVVTGFFVTLGYSEG